MTFIDLTALVLYRRKDPVYIYPFFAHARFVYLFALFLFCLALIWVSVWDAMQLHRLQDSGLDGISLLGPLFFSCSRVGRCQRETDDHDDLWASEGYDWQDGVLCI